MHKLHSFILTAHRILGTLLSILFCMWFLSGLVMIYHYFPRVNKTDKWSKMENLKDFGNLPAWEEIQASIPADERIRKSYLEITRHTGNELVSRSRQAPVIRFLEDSWSLAIYQSGRTLLGMAGSDSSLDLFHLTPTGYRPVDSGSSYSLRHRKSLLSDRIIFRYPWYPIGPTPTKAFTL